jgi:hypothetical protein
MKGLDQFKHPTMNTLPLVLRGASKIGWYEGSGFFLIMSKFSHIPLNAYTYISYTNVSSGILNYKWAQSGIFDIYDKTIAGILTGLLAAAGAAYWKSNDKPTAMTLAAVAILQGLGVRNGWYHRLA